MDFIIWWIFTLVIIVGRIAIICLGVYCILQLLKWILKGLYYLIVIQLFKRFWKKVIKGEKE